MLIWAMVTDCLDFSEWKLNVRSDGSMYSLYTFSRKIGSTIASTGAATALAAIGYCFGDHKDHMSTPAIPDEATRNALAAEGKGLIDALVARMDMPHVVDQMRSLEAYNIEVAKKFPWVPFAGAVGETI